MNKRRRNSDKSTWGSWNIWGKKFAHEVEGLWLASPGISFEDLLRSLRHIRTKYLMELEGDAKATLEIKRRISEYALEFALSHGCSLTVCRGKFRECQSLGFTDSFREAHFCLLYAESIAERGHRRAALTVSRKTIALLDLASKGRKAKNEQVQTYRKWAQRIVSKVEIASTP